MNIEEVKQLHKNLEKDIFELVNKFERDTNLCVDKIDLDYLVSSTVCGVQVRRLTDVFVEIRL
jgi:hypothetical protein